MSKPQSVILALAFSLAACATQTRPAAAGGGAPTAATAAAGAPAAASTDSWQFSVAPYLWAAGMEGSATVRGRSAPVDVDFADDVIENLDSALVLHAEARHGDWAFIFDPTYLKLRSDTSVGPLDVDVEAELAIVDAKVARRVWGTVEVLAGARYLYNSVTVDIDALGFDRSADKSWVDPVIGARAHHPLGNGFTAWGEADIGGFGVGSDAAWNVTGLLAYAINQHLDVALGYRILSIDYDDGNGNERFEYNVMMSGFLAGLNFRF